MCMFIYTCMRSCSCACVCVSARVCVRMCFACPAVSHTKFKLSCGNISLALQSACVTWWTEGTPHMKQCCQGCRDPLHLRSALLKNPSMASADEKCLPEGVFPPLLTCTSASANWKKDWIMLQCSVNPRCNHRSCSGIEAPLTVHNLKTLQNYTPVDMKTIAGLYLCVSW